MKRTFFAVAITLLPATAPESFGRSPDQVAHSPIPRLRSNYRVARAIFARQPIPSALFSRDTPLVEGSDTRTAKNRDASLVSSQSEYQSSSDWQTARASVLEFARRSAQTSPAEAEQFLDRLSNLSVSEQRDWLRRYQQRRASINRAERSRELARRKQWLKRERRQQDRIGRIAQLQTAASSARSSQASGRFIAKAKPFSDLDFEGLVRPVYNPLIPILDPSSPQGDVARAASLLGESFAAAEAAALTAAPPAVPALAAE